MQRLSSTFWVSDDDDCGQEIEFKEAETGSGFHSIRFEPPPLNPISFFSLPSGALAQPVDPTKALLVLT